MTSGPSDRRRRTKIIATLGPATDDPRVLGRMIDFGLDVARVNFSHGSADAVARRVQMVRDLARARGRDIGVLGDLQGPKLRVQRFASGQAELLEGADFALDPDLGVDAGDAAAVGIAYRDLADDLSAGDVLLLDDGQIVLDVVAVTGRRIATRVRTGGMLKNNKGLNRLGGGLSANALTEKDREDIRTAAALGVDFVAVSFVRDAVDMHEARQLLREAGSNALLVAKIERTEAVTNAEALIDASDAIMVARGDLGVEVGYAELPGLQKRIIRQTQARNGLAITATQMMESMINSPLPTRAEVSDVANAVLDGTDAVMLSAETAVGRYPAQAVKIMSEVCTAAEKQDPFRGDASPVATSMFHHVDEAIARAVTYAASHMHVRAIIALTESGGTARWMSRVRSDIPIYAFTRHEATARRVSLYRGVYPVGFDVTGAGTDPGLLVRKVFDVLLEKGLVTDNDQVIMTKGDQQGVSGRTNSMMILTVTRA